MGRRSHRLVVATGGLVKLALSAGVLCVLLEVSARLIIFGPLGLDPRRVGILRDVAPSDFVTYETERAILYEYKPKLDTFFKLVAFRTNSRGMRDQEYAVEKPPDTYRVAVLGSSFTLPAGVEIESAFHSLLEERLSAEFAPRSYEFLNFSVGLHGPSQFIAMLRYRALAFDPDLIFFPVTRMAVPHLLRDWNSLPPRNVLDLVDPSGPRSYFLRLLETRLDLKPLPLSTGAPQFPRAAAQGPDVIEKLGEISRETGIPIAVVRIEFDPRRPTPVERTVQRRVEAAELFYVDTRHAFLGEDPRDFWLYELDPHPNREAHAIFADVLGDFLRTHDLLGR